MTTEFQVPIRSHRLVRVLWEGPYSLDEINYFDGTERERDRGLYLIEGHYGLYGCKGSLYLGITEKQFFAERINQHTGCLKYEQGFTVRLGVLYHDDYCEGDYQ